MSANPNEPINEIQCHSALDDARRLLQYWRNEHANAMAINDEQQAKQCKRLVQQCELVVAALTGAKVASGLHREQS